MKAEMPVVTWAGARTGCTRASRISAAMAEMSPTRGIWTQRRSSTRMSVKGAMAKEDIVGWSLGGGGLSGVGGQNRSKLRRCAALVHPWD